jgi:scyllo-inositol 2-dehydrogenase (NADP+)
MIDNQYAVVIVGFGGMGNWHYENFQMMRNPVCAGIYDIDEEVSRKAGSRGIRTYVSLTEVLADPCVDIILIVTPNDTHKEIALAAMRAGKAVVCEKPVTLSSGDLTQMIQCANECKVLFTVHQNRRWDADYQIVKELLREKTLGEVFRIESRVHGSRGIPGDWRGRKEQGGGMVLDWGVHILDQLLMMIPEKIRTVYAEMTHVTNCEVDDGFRITLEFESGLSVLAEVGTSHFIQLPRWMIYGENGTAQIDDFSAKGRIISVRDWNKNDAIPVRTAAGLTKTMAPRTDETIRESALPEVQSDIREFFHNVTEVLDGKAAPFITHEQLMRCMKLMEACFLSDTEKRVVFFE